MYGHCSHLGYANKTVFINLCPPSKRSSTYNLALSGQAVSEKNNGHIHVYNPGAGTDIPMGSILLKNINYLSICSFAASFLVRLLLNSSPIQTRRRPNLTLPYYRSRST